MAQKFVAPFDPNEYKDYVRDWTSEMDAVGDTISSTTFTLPQAATDAGLQILNAQVVTGNKKTVFWLKSTTPAASLTAYNNAYLPVDHTITTAGGRIYNETLLVKIKEK